MSNDWRNWADNENDEALLDQADRDVLVAVAKQIADGWLPLSEAEQINAEGWTVTVPAFGSLRGYAPRQVIDNVMLDAESLRQAYALAQKIMARMAQEEE